ncbi:MAG: alpha/beta hydrolase [Planctomycetota bacterium]
MPPDPGVVASTDGGVEEDVRHRVVRVRFATDRDYDPNARSNQAFGANRSDLRYGICEVSIPADHRMGELESPGWMELYRENPDKHVVLMRIDTQSALEFFEVFHRDAIDDDAALLFVHGYNVEFKDAARRTGQMAYDLGFLGTPMFFSWPSRGEPTAYARDGDQAKASKSNLREVVESVLDHTQTERLYVIAHSMGTRATTRVVSELIRERPELRGRIRELVLAAPDIDADVFRNEIAPALISSGAPVTLYASSGDRTLELSRRYHGAPRAGYAGDDMVIVPGIETIDATGVATSFWGHSYYAERRSILSDLFSMFRHGVRASDRFGLETIREPRGTYWRFRP